MKERERAGLAVALACVMLILLRTLSPSFRASYDWISLTLTLLAFLGLMLPPFLPLHPFKKRDTRPPHLAFPQNGPTPPIFEENPAPSSEEIPSQTETSFPWQALQTQMDAFAWPAAEGGLYDGLLRLAQDQVHTAVCGAYATLLLLCNPDSFEKPTDVLFEPLQDSGRLSPEQTKVFIELLDLLKQFTQLGPTNTTPEDAHGLLHLTLRAIARLQYLTA